MGKQAFVGLQMLFVAFGALVLVPLITGLNSNTALLTAGIGTLLFQLCTGKQVPYFLSLLFCLYCTYSIWRTNLGHSNHNGWTCLCRLRLFRTINLE